MLVVQCCLLSIVVCCVSVDVVRRVWIIVECCLVFVVCCCLLLKVHVVVFVVSCSSVVCLLFAVCGLMLFVV